MAKKHETIAERKERLQAQLDKLGELEVAENLLNEFIESLNEKMKNLVCYDRYCGKEESQAIDEKGNLLWKISDSGMCEKYKVYSWYSYTKDELVDEKGMSLEEFDEYSQPYYNDKYETVRLTEEDLAPGGNYGYKHDDYYGAMLLRDILADIEL